MGITSSISELLMRRGVQTASARTALRRQWLVVAILGYTALGVAGWLEVDRFWMYGACVAWSGIIAGFYLLLDTNRSEPNAPLLEKFTLPTLITMFRGLLLAILTGFLFVSSPIGVVAWFAAITYSLAACLDYVDGSLARRWDASTELGARLDMELDSFGILVAVILGSYWGKLPEWYLLIGLARYVFVFGEWCRRSCGKIVRELDPYPLRRHLAGWQMGFLAVSLCPLILIEVSRLAASVFGVLTLGMFFRDWLVISNLAPPRSLRVLKISRSALRQVFTALIALFVIVLARSVDKVGLTFSLGGAFIISLIVLILVSFEQHW